jgi:hypothetical protein
MRCIACNKKLVLFAHSKEAELCRECNIIGVLAARDLFFSEKSYQQEGSLDDLMALECGIQKVSTKSFGDSENWELKEGYHREESAPIADYFDKYEE